METYNIAEICNSLYDIRDDKPENRDLVANFYVRSPKYFMNSAEDFKLNDWDTYMKNPRGHVRYMYLTSRIYYYTTAGCFTYGEVKKVLSKILTFINTDHPNDYGEIPYAPTIRDLCVTNLEKLRAHQHSEKALESSIVTGFSPVVPYVSSNTPLRTLMDTAAVPDYTTVIQRCADEIYNMATIMDLYRCRDAVIESWEAIEKEGPIGAACMLHRYGLPNNLQCYLMNLYVAMYSDRIDPAAIEKMEKAFNTNFEDFIGVVSEIYSGKSDTALENMAFFEDLKNEYLLDKMNVEPVLTEGQDQLGKSFDIRRLIGFIVNSRRYRTNQYARSYFANGAKIAHFTYYDDYVILEPKTKSGDKSPYVYVPVIDDAQLGKIVLVRMHRNGNIDVTNTIDEDEVDNVLLSEQDVAEEGFFADIARKKYEVWIAFSIYENNIARRGLLQYDHLWDTMEQAVANHCFVVDNKVRLLSSKIFPDYAVAHIVIRSKRGKKKIWYHNGCGNAEDFEIVRVLEEKKVGHEEIVRCLKACDIDLQLIEASNIDKAMKSFSTICKDAKRILKEKFDEINFSGISPDRITTDQLRDLLEDSIEDGAFMNDSMVEGAVGLAAWDLNDLINPDEYPFRTKEYFDKLNPIADSIEKAVTAADSEFRKKYPRGYKIVSDWDKFEGCVNLEIQTLFKF